MTRNDLAFIPHRAQKGSDIPRHRLALRTLEWQTIGRDTPSLPEKRVLGLVVVRLTPWYKEPLYVPRETQRSRVPPPAEPVDRCAIAHAYHVVKRGVRS
jgi:hypothetical protein